MKTITKPTERAMIAKYGLLDPEEVAAGTRSQFDCRLEGGLLYELDSGVGYEPIGAPKIAQEKTELGNALNFYDPFVDLTTSSIPFTMPSVRGSTVSGECWYNPAFRRSDQYYTLIGSGNLDALINNNWALVCYNGLIQVVGSAGIITAPATDILTLGNWYHIAFAASDDVGTIYINGKVAVTGALILANTNATGEYLGRRERGSLGPGGLIAAPRVYSILRTAAEIQASYDMGAKLLQFRTTNAIKTNTSSAGQTGGYVGGNSPFLIQSGTWSVDYDIDVTEDISKVLTCDVAGVVTLESIGESKELSSRAYGTWNFWFKKKETSVTSIWFGDENTPFTTFNGYELRIDANQAVYLISVAAGVATNIAVSGPNLVMPGVWTQLTVTRRFDGQWTIWGNRILMVAVIGTNPVTNSTVKAFPIISFDFDAGDQLALAGKRAGGLSDDYSFTKRLGVVTP